MDFKKCTAIIVAAVMVMTCLIPIYGNGTDAADTYFVNDIDQETEVPPGYIGIFSVDDLKKVGTDYDDGEGTIWGADASYILMNDITFTEDDDLPGIPISVSASLTTSKLTVTVKTGDTAIEGATISVLGTTGTTGEDGKVEISATFTSSVTYTAVVAGVYNDGTEDHEFAIAVTPLKTSSTTDVEQNSAGNFESIPTFSGIFNGNGYVISGMNISVYAADTNVFAGMFVMMTGTVENLGLTGGSVVAFAASMDPALFEFPDDMDTELTVADAYESVSGGAWVGGIAVNMKGSIVNCYNENTVAAASEGTVIVDSYFEDDNAHLLDGLSVGQATAGGIASYLAYESGAAVESCYSNGTVAAIAGDYTQALAGGVVGYYSSGSVTDSYSIGFVSATAGGESCAGGVIGFVEKDYDLGTIADITGNYNHSAIYSESVKKAYAGGIVGETIGKVYSDYNVGSVTAKSTGDDAFAGGIAGKGSMIFNCFNSAAVSSTSVRDHSASSGGIAGTAENIFNCYSNASPTGITATASNGTTNKGGIAGLMNTDEDEGEIGMITNCYFLTSTSSSAVKYLVGNGYTDDRCDEGLLIDNIIRTVTESEVEDFDPDDPKYTYEVDAESIRKVAPSGSVSSASNLYALHTYYSAVTDLNGSDPNDAVGVDYIPGWWDETPGVTPWLTPRTDVGFSAPYLDGMLPYAAKIVKQPESVWMASNDLGEVTFEVEAQSNFTITYTWQSASSITGSWSSASGTRTNSTYTVDATDSTALSKYYRCRVAISGANSAISSSTYVYTDPVKINTYTAEIKTLTDLLNISKNLDGDYILMNNLEFTEDDDLNGGTDMKVDVSVIENTDTLKITVTDADGKAASGMYVVIMGESKTTNTSGVAEFDGLVTGNKVTNALTVYVGGVFDGENIAVAYDIEANHITGSVEASGNGNFDPIGSWSAPFTGKFDGNGYTIKGLNTSAYSESSDGGEIVASSGLFGYIGEGGEVTGLSLTGGSSLAIAVSPGTYDAFATSGGIAGYVAGGKVADSSNANSIYSTAYATDGSHDAWGDSGGITGGTNGATIERCSNTGEIKGMFSGGISGFEAGSENGTVIKDCFNTGSVHGGKYAAGILGYSDVGDEADASISNCLSTGTISCSEIGLAYGIAWTAESVTNCYFKEQDGISGLVSSAIVDGDDGRTTQKSGAVSESDLKKRSTYFTGTTTVNGETVSGWDFTSGKVWKMTDGNLPYLVAVESKGGSEDGGDGFDDWWIVAVVIAVIVVALAAFMLLRRRK